MTGVRSGRRGAIVITSFRFVLSLLWRSARVPGADVMRGREKELQMDCNHYGHVINGVFCRAWASSRICKRRKKKKKQQSVP